MWSSKSQCACVCVKSLAGDYYLCIYKQLSESWTVKKHSHPGSAVLSAAEEEAPLSSFTFSFVSLLSSSGSISPAPSGSSWGLCSICICPTPRFHSCSPPLEVRTDVSEDFATSSWSLIGPPGLGQWDFSPLGSWQGLSLSGKGTNTRCESRKGKEGLDLLVEGLELGLTGIPGPHPVEWESQPGESASGWCGWCKLVARVWMPGSQPEGWRPPFPASILTLVIKGSRGEVTAGGSRSQTQVWDLGFSPAK